MCENPLTLVILGDIIIEHWGTASHTAQTNKRRLITEQWNKPWINTSFYGNKQACYLTQTLLRKVCEWHVSLKFI